MSLTDDNENTSPDQSEDMGANAAESPTTDTDGIAADSSPADSGEQGFTDAVLSALEKPEVAPASKDSPGDDAEEKAEKPAADKEGDAGDPDPDELSEKEMAALSERTRNRISTLLNERKDVSEKAKGLEQEIEKLRPEAESYRKVTEFMRENSLTAQDAGQALHLAGLINSNPAEAFEALKPIMAKLAEQAGAVMPQDLAEDVRLGRITQTHARELAQARAQNVLSKRQASAESERRAQEAKDRESSEKARHVQTLMAAADQMATDRMQSDPDWKIKEPLVVDKLQIDLSKNGMPKSQDELRQRFDAVVKDVTAYLLKVAPRDRPALKPTESVSSPNRAKTPPKDATEAVLRALE